jgi:carbonic anhydrase
MKLTRSSRLAAALSLGLVGMFLIGCADSPKHSSVAAEPQPLARLESGNQRFVAGTPRAKDLVRERGALVAGQHPYAVVLACADSRVAPELVFDETVGNLFVVRVAGNVVDPTVLGSIEYAVEHLHVTLLVVMGHDSCGAVQAALAGGEVTPNIGAMLAPEAPAVATVRAAHLEGSAAIDAAVRQNVQNQIKSVSHDSPLLAEAVEKQSLRVVGAVYHLDSGRVEMLPGPAR